MTDWWEKLPRAEWAKYERILPNLHWFEVYRVRENIFAIYEPGHFEEVISFLIVGDEKALLFDTGLGLQPIKPVVRQLTCKPLLVVNSHSHYDHVGGNYEFDSILGLKNDFYAQSSKGLSNEKIGQFYVCDWLPTPPSSDFSAEAFAVRPWSVAGAVADGDVIDLGGRRFEVLETPGESPDGLSLFDRDNRLLFVGDIFYLGPLYAHLPESDYREYKRSARRLAALEPFPTTLFTSHNVPIVGPVFLRALNEAFFTIDGESAANTNAGDVLQFQFEGFSVLLPRTENHRK